MNGSSDRRLKQLRALRRVQPYIATGLAFLELLQSLKFAETTTDTAKLAAPFGILDLSSLFIESEEG